MNKIETIEDDRRHLLAPFHGEKPVAPQWFNDAIARAPVRTFTDVRGAAIETLAWGEHGKPGLLFLHGNGASADWWSFIAPFFADTLEAKRLLAFYDFENEARIFAEVHHAYLRFKGSSQHCCRRGTRYRRRDDQCVMLIPSGVLLAGAALSERRLGQGSACGRPRSGAERP